MNQLNIFFREYKHYLVKSYIIHIDCIFSCILYGDQYYDIFISITVIPYQYLVSLECIHLGL